jgi:prepilin signal peptidase PulO-like enzyme (type II secretory pathway)
LIDFDEKSIPDAITTSGTLLGLALAVAYPWSLLSAGDWLILGAPEVEFLTLISPNPWPAELGGWPLKGPLAIGLGCWTLWCGGLLPRRWNTRRGLKTAVRVFFHRLRVEPITYRILALWLAGAAAIALAAWLAPAANWAALLTALFGMAAAGGMIWMVRIIGGVTLKREAMGFGDVTLMSMIGAFLGWQAALMVFFLAPFAGLVIGLAQWVFRGDHEIPYGPFLCLGAFGVILDWTELWDRMSDVFALGWLLAALLAACMALMGVMLLAYRVLRDRTIQPG